MNPGISAKTTQGLERQAGLAWLKFPRVKIEHDHAVMPHFRRVQHRLLHHEQGEKTKIAAAANRDIGSQESQGCRGYFQKRARFTRNHEWGARRFMHAIAVVTHRVN